MASPSTPILANRYHLDSIVYSDSTVVAYQARDQLLNRTVTVELLRAEQAADPTLVQRILDKARNAAIANLPHVAALYDQNTVDQRPFLVLEELAGPPLAERVPLAPEQAITLVEKLGATLEAAISHGQPLPTINDQTVRISHENRVQVLDLGLEQTPPDPEYAVTILGRLLGISIKGAADLNRVTPLRTLAERAANGEYQSIGDFLNELHAVDQLANTPTTVIPRTHPTIPVPDAARVAPAPAPSAPAVNHTPVVQAAPAAQRKMLLIGAAAVVALLLITGAIAMSRGGTSPASSSPAPAAETSPASSAAASAAPTTPGQIFIVNTRGRQTLVVRSGPGRASPRVGSLAFGSQVEVIGGPQAADGYTWVQIRAPNLTGWCISEALRKP